MSAKYLYLPYKTQTITNKKLEFNFRLDPNTVSPTTINEIVSLLLNKISSEIEKKQKDKLASLKKNRSLKRVQNFGLILLIFLGVICSLLFKLIYPYCLFITSSQKIPAM